MLVPGGPIYRLHFFGSADGCNHGASLADRPSCPAIVELIRVGVRGQVYREDPLR